MKKRIIALLTVSCLCLALLAGCASSSPSAAAPSPSPSRAAEASPSANPAPAEPIKITMTYSDNPTLPFKEDWLGVVEAQKLANLDITWEVIPTNNYDEKILTELNSGTPFDVILYRTVTKGDLATLALNGAIAPVSDYSDYTPNFNKKVADWGLTDDINALTLSDGKLYFMPALFDKQFYDGGLLLREDLLSEFNLPAPKTYDDLYNVLKTFKEHYPDSYPLTTLVGPRVLYRMTMPSFGVSLGQNASTSTWVLSWDYNKKEYFAGAISDQYKAYLEYFAKLYKEGLLDPEFIQDGDLWTAKLATNRSMATYAYYDQIGGILTASEIDGIAYNLYPPLEGTAGAHHQPKSRTANGPLFTASCQKRADFTDIVAAVDKMFFSDEAAELWCLGVEGTTYNMVNGKVDFVDSIKNSVDGVYKALQLQYGLGSDTLQYVWVNEREMTKYDDNYAEINATVAAMPDAIQAIPPTVLFDAEQSEQAGFLQGPLADAFDIWADDFIRGKKSLDTDWDAYVSAMKALGIDDMVKLYNDNRR